MARPKRNNSSGDPTTRPKIIPISPRRKQARSIPPTSSVHDETSPPDPLSGDSVDAETPSQNCSCVLTSAELSAGLFGQGVDAQLSPPPRPPNNIQTKLPADGKKRLAPQRRGVASASRKFSDGDEKHGAAESDYYSQEEEERENYDADNASESIIQRSVQLYAPSTTLLSLPNEILLHIAHKFREPDLNCFSRSNHRLYILLTHRLYRLGKEIEYLDASNLLHWASQKGLVNTVRHLLEEGANPNSKFQRASHPLQADGRTPLHIAAEKGNRRIAKLLLEKGAKTKVWDREGNTPLHLAVRYGKAGMVKLLVSAGAKITARNAEGMRPLHVAIQEEKPGIVKLLLDLGADVAAADRTGGTALHLAASFYTFGVCQRLIKAGADVNAKDVAGMAPLHWASYTGWGMVARLLVRHGARLDERDNEGRSPWHWAGIGGNREVFTYLGKFADVIGDLKDKQGNKPRLGVYGLPLTGILYPVC